MQLRRGNKEPKKSKNVVEYEIKTYGSIADRNKSPGYSNNQYTNKRSPKRREKEGDEGEMNYMNPNEMNVLNQIRSPIRIPSNKRNSKKYRDNTEREEAAKNNDYTEYKIPPNAMNLDSRREKLKRSPKTINLGETPHEIEYNMKSINRPKNNVNESLKDKDKESSVIERTYNMISNEAGNIFLDQPIHQKSFVNQQEVIEARGSFDSKDLKDMQYSMNPRDFHEPLSGIFGKMSPKGNIEVDSESNSEKNENINNNQIKDLRTQ